MISDQLSPIIFVPGPYLDSGEVRLLASKDDFGIIYLDVWTSRSLGEQYFAEKGKDIPVSQVERDQFIQQIHAQGEIRYLFVDRRASDDSPGVNYLVASHHPRRAVYLKSILDVWPAIKAYMKSESLLSNYYLDRFRTFWGRQFDTPMLEALRRFAASITPDRELSPWDGKMECAACDYLWESRRDTPPARCPRCGSVNKFPIRNIAF